MNVLMMVSWYVAKDSGADLSGIFHYEQAMSLKKYCKVAIYYPYDRDVDGMTDEIENGIRVYRSKYKLENKLRNRFNMFRAMKKIKRNFKPDIIHAQVATEAGRFAVALGKAFGIPVIITEHSTVEASGVKKFPHHMYADFAYRYSVYNICVSEYLRDELKKIFPQYAFHTIYNGISIPENINKLPEYRVEGYTNMILVAALYDWEIKGIPSLLEIIKKLKDEECRVKLHIVGDGEFLEKFQDLANRLEIQDDCIFYGRFSKNEVYSILQQMDFLVSASKFESFGCSIAEAMMMGKPVVATKSGGPESIITEETGILVENGDIQALHDGILKMMNNYWRYDSEKIKRYARERFDIDLVSQKYVKIYEEYAKK